MPRTLFLLLALPLLLATALVASPAPSGAAPATNAGAVVLVNSQSPSYFKFQYRVQRYLEHLGVPYTTVDVSSASVTPDIGQYALIIIGHESIDASGTYLSNDEQQAITDAVSTGTGLVNFDSNIRLANDTDRYAFVDSIFNFTYNGTWTGGTLRVPSSAHYITQLQPAPIEWGPRGPLDGPSVVPPAGVTTLAQIIAAGPETKPLMTVTSFGQGRALQWLSDDWLDPAVFGLFAGWDDLVWRGFAWAARKPFVLRGMPPLVTMRVDDAAGFGAGAGTWNYVHISNEYGFKPFLAFMNEDMSPQEAQDLKALVDQGKATASIHTRTYNDYFYFDHNAGQPLSNTQVAANFAAWDAFHATYGFAPSTAFVPHFYESGANVYDELDARGVKYLVGVNQVNVPYAESTPPNLLGPFREFEAPGPNTHNNNVYFADSLFIGPGHPLNGKFFVFVTEVREDFYDWLPNHWGGQQAAIDSGSLKLRRALSSMVPAALMWHEQSSHGVSAASFEAQIAAITSSVASYNPIYVTMDYAALYAQNLTTSDLASATINPSTSTLSVTFSGSTSIDTQFYLFTGSGGNVNQTMLNAPAFTNGTVVNVPITGDFDPPSSAITDPANGQQLSGASYTIRGTAGDAGGSGVQRVEVSTDGGSTWQTATGTTSWSYAWNLPAGGSHNIRSRAVDNAGNTEAPGAGVNVTVVDTAAPVISNVVATGITSEGATIAWDTNEPSTTQVEYGTTTSYGSFAPPTPNPALVTSHSQGIAGLQPNTLYHYRVRSTDGAGNPAVSGDFTFTTTPAFSGGIETTYADFADGSLSGTAISEDGDGEVRLAPAFSDLFRGPSLDTSAWRVKDWTGGGTFVASGRVTAQGQGIGTLGTFSAGAAFEASVTFGAGMWQQAGVGSDLDGLEGNNRATFTTAFQTDRLWARTTINGADSFIEIPGSGAYIGTPHVYEIRTTASGVSFFIDGAQVATTQGGIPGLYYAWVSDYASDGPPIAADWVRVRPYAAAGTYESNALDAGSGETFDAIGWTAFTPAGASLNVQARTSTDGASWSAWSATLTNGAQLPSPARFAQYRLSLATTNTDVSPVVSDVAINVTGGPAPTNTPAANTPTATATSVAPTDTPAASTATPTSTSAAPTNTPAPATNTPTATSTPVPPTPTPTTTPGGASSALGFDGANDIATAADSASLDLVGPMTIEAWVKFDDVTEWKWHTIVFKQAGSNLAYALYYRNGVLFEIRSGGRNIAVADNKRLQTGTWYHIAAVYDRQSMRVYVNGVRTATRSFTGAVNTSNGPVSLGANTVWNDEQFEGVIDEVRLSNVARYATNFTPATTLASDANTAALWHLDEGTGQTAADASGNNNTLRRGSSTNAEASDPGWVGGYAGAGQAAAALGGAAVLALGAVGARTRRRSR